MTATALLHEEPAEVRSVGLVGTYPPTQCGIATFTESLGRWLAPPGSTVEVGIVRCLTAPAREEHLPEVVAELVEGSTDSIDAAAVALSEYDVAVIQHEYGIYGGPDGADVLALAGQVESPLIAVLHTVLRKPSPRQKEILEELAAQVEFLVVQSGAARNALLDTYAVDPRVVRLIPHGARPNLSLPSAARTGSRRPLVLTWGLLGPGKGIETAIDALVGLAELDPVPRYLVFGATHPKVAAAEGEAYRDRLRRRAEALGVAHMLEFEPGYHTAARIRKRIREADVILLPYQSREQVVSGILTEAIASGKPIVSTAFPHAVEMLAAGSGLLVPHDDPMAIAVAIRSLLTDEGLASRVSDAARRQAPSLYWSTVAESYLLLAAQAAARRLELR